MRVPARFYVHERTEARDLTRNTRWAVVDRRSNRPVDDCTSRREAQLALRYWNTVHADTPADEL